MCNHIGSYILNDVLKVMCDFGIFEEIGKKKTQELTLKILEVGENYNCSKEEILDGMSQVCGICNFCLSTSADIDEEGLCAKCRQDK